VSTSGSRSSRQSSQSGEKAPIVPIDRVVSVIAFHEKAGRSQVGSFWYLLAMLFLPSRVATVATLPSALFDEQFLVRSVQVGCSRFSQCCHLIIDLGFIIEDESWARRLTQSPELGFSLWLFLFAERFWFYAAAGIALGLLLCNGSYASPLTHR
jgi:hypothetical protein